MNGKIIVSANCLTGGLAAALRILLPSWTIRPIPLPGVGDVNAANVLNSELSDSAFWISSGHFYFAENKNVKLCRYSDINFDVFHPDLTYATRKGTGERTKGHYNSRIAAWAYNNRLDPGSAKKLFCSTTYRALGYFNYWDNAYGSLKKSFIDNEFSESDFYEFFLPLKREGNFMYSINHPRPSAVVRLAWLYARKISRDPLPERREIVIPDGLLSTIWPVYPEVGEELGIEGGYSWRLDGAELEGVDSYLEYIYKEYDSQGLAPGDVCVSAFHPFVLNAPSNFDVVLSHLWGRK